jgi:hypothetical protein
MHGRYYNLIQNSGRVTSRKRPLGVYTCVGRTILQEALGTTNRLHSFIPTILLLLRVYSLAR